MNRIVFLDIDGVLAPIRNYSGYMFVCHDLLPPNGCLKFDTYCVDQLNQLCTLTGAKIVISSSWRHYIPDIEKMRAMFIRQGVTAEVIGMTPEAQDSWPDCSRGAEIKAFMDAFDGEIENFVIVDDSDMGFIGLEDRWVRTDCTKGLHSEDCIKAQRILTYVDLTNCRWKTESCGDHLESLVCPVVMSAKQVMEFERAQQRVVELEQCLSEADETLMRFDCQESLEMHLKIKKVLKHG